MMWVRGVTPNRWSMRTLAGASAGAALFIFAACGGSSGKPETSSTAAGPTPNSAATEAAGRVAFLEQRVQRDPLDVFGLNSLAMEHMQRARETGDVTELARADDALSRSLRIRLNDNYEALILLASVTATKHDFARALTLAETAIPQKPNQAYGYGVLGDAYMGLGRYDDAATAYARMGAIEPGLAASGRRALLLQTRGQADEAERAWLEAVRFAADDGVPEHAAWAHAQLANVYFLTGRIDDAGREYQASLDAFPGYVHASAGLGKVAAARGDMAAAIDQYNRAVNIVPLPEYVIALGDVYAASGDQKNADAQYALVGAIEQLYVSNGVNLDLQIGLFNADHGRDIAAALERTKALWAQQPSLQATDALAWVAYRAGDVGLARENIESALAVGTHDPLILFHAGMIFRAVGDGSRGADYLQRAVDINPAFSVLQAPAALRALAEVRAAG